jgi:hypothetical protein
MAASLDTHKRRSFIDAILQWWRFWVNNGPILAIPACYAESEVERLANNIGMPASEIRRLANLGPEAAELLLRRMAALGLDHRTVVQMQPQMFRNLQRTCTLCESHRQCARDLSRYSDDRAWEGYCPNVAALRALGGLPGAARTVR